MFFSIWDYLYCFYLLILKINETIPLTFKFENIHTPEYNININIIG